MNKETPEVNIFTKEGQSELIIRQGKALDPKEPLIIDLSGDIFSVANFLTMRTGGKAGFGTQYVDPEKAVVVVDINAGTITLMLDPENHYGATIKGKLEASDELKIFNINSPKTYTREELIKLFRFNRLHFADFEKHAELLAAFQRFSAKAYVDMKNESDTRGNRENNFAKRVETQLPEEFILNIPIFKGMEKERFRVEIALDVTDAGARFWFESPELVELIEVRKKEIFDIQLTRCSQFPIINK